MFGILALVATGCVAVSEPGDTGADSDTGEAPTVTEEACPLDVVPLGIQACVDTTAALEADETTEYYGDYSVEVASTGLVTEVGGVLDPVVGSLPVHGYQACGADHAQQVRLIDDNGDTWTFGWNLDTDVDDGSTSAIVAGSDLDFTVIQEASYFFARGAVLLSDAIGPLFLFELEPIFDAETRGGVSVNIDSADTCLVQTTDGEYEHYLVTFDWGDGEVALRSGQSAQVPLPARELEVTLGASMWMTDCSDGCGASVWAAWPEGPE